MSIADFPKEPLNGAVEKIEKIISDKKELITNLIETQEKNYKNIITPFQTIEMEINDVFSPLSLIHNVASSEESEKVYLKVIELIDNFSFEIYNNQKLFEAIQEVSKNETLSEIQKRVIEKIVFQFKMNGLELSPKKQKKLKKISLELSKLSNQFSQNILKDINQYRLTVSNPEDVEGISESDLERVKKGDKWEFSLQIPDYIAFMTYSKNRKLRKELYKAFNQKGAGNETVIDRILELKNREAQLLGFQNYAELSIADKMASSTDEVLKFLHSLLEKSRAKSKEELKEIKEFSKLSKFKFYDLPYYTNLYKKEKLSFDSEEYRPYFEKNRVVEHSLNLISKLFGVRFRKLLVRNSWNEKVELYEVYKKNRVLGRIYLDLEAREGKRDGAWMSDWKNSHIDGSGVFQPAIAFIVCNFPASSENSPSLLRHSDVETLLHELGHGIHHIFSQVSEYSLSGTNVEWDAVEFPSQFLEYFSYDRDFLTSLGEHYQTKEKLSNEMVDKLIENRNFLSALGMVRQLEFSIFDFKLHLKLYQGDEVQKLLNSVRKETAPMKYPKYVKFQNGFSHIFAGGYSAGYYSYKWAEVLSADLFLEITKEGIINQELAQKYFTTILQKGGSKKMGELFFELMGREPNPEALISLYGIE